MGTLRDVNLILSFVPPNSEDIGRRRTPQVTAVLLRYGFITVVSRGSFQNGTCLLDCTAIMRTK
jgi:hypothetical protein